VNIKLLDGESKQEWDAFNEKLVEVETQQRSTASMFVTGMESETAAVEEDDEEDGALGGVPEEEQPFLNIHRQNSLIGNERMAAGSEEVLQADEPLRKEIKLENGVADRGVEK